MPEHGYWYGIDGKRYGPVSFEKLRELVGTGQLRPTDYIWSDRYQVWTRVVDFPGLDDDSSPPADDSTVPGGDAGESPWPAAEEPGWETAEEDAVFEIEPRYAGFWIRLGAYIIDSLVVGFLTVIWAIIAAQLGLFDQLAALESQPEPDFRQLWESLPAAYYMGSFIIVWLYEALLVSSSWQATIGKRSMGIVVVDHDGGRCGFWQASVRSWVKSTLSGIFLIGFLLVLIDPRRQALHDMIARTFCEKR